ncbi:uncharacterized protein LOC143281504 [Babylonia areolata]|uniref:uncharacterized protein LOC143281504 n=1 Tax=Babylonia areolata TaxID=304850 RepID=UPI003FD409A8
MTCPYRYDRRDRNPTQVRLSPGRLWECGSNFHTSTAGIGVCRAWPAPDQQYRWLLPPAAAFRRQRFLAWGSALSVLVAVFVCWWAPLKNPEGVARLNTRGVADEPRGVWAPMNPGVAREKKGYIVIPEYCDGVQFNSSLQCCCDETLNDIPKHDCQCCGTKAYLWNQTKPDKCMGTCGTQRYHVHTQMCCDEIVRNSSSNTDICCGRQIFDSETYSCCNRTIPVDRKTHGCCEWRYPFNKATMRCDRKSRVASLKIRQRFRPLDLCQRGLPLYDVTWPALPLRNASHTHIRAIPDSCRISVRKDNSGDTRITVPFSSFAIVWRHPVQDCPLTTAPGSTPTLRLVVKVRGREGSCDVTDRDLQDYLHGKVMDLYVRKGLLCAEGEGPVLRLKAGNNAVIFLGGAARSLMAQTLH